MRHSKPMFIAVMALGAFACDNRESGTTTTGYAPGPATAAATTNTTGPAGDDAVAANAQLVRLKLPGMV